MSDLEVSVPFPDQACLDILTAAAEGPCMLVWCRSISRAPGFTDVWYIDLTREGLRAYSPSMVEHAEERKLRTCVSVPGIRSALSRMLCSPSKGFRRIAAAALVDVGDVDAAMADVIVQHAVFGDDAPFG